MAQTITLELTDEQAAILLALGQSIGYKTAQETAAYLMRCVWEGSRGVPGSWERQWLGMVFEIKDSSPYTSGPFQRWLERTKPPG